MTEVAPTNPQKIYLKDAKVIFANLVDEGFGRSITIDATEPEVATAIDEWVSSNNIGKGPNAGKANFKTYEGTVQYSFRMNDNTKIVYNNGLSENELGYGSVVSLASNAFEYDNKFGKGTSASLSAVIVQRGRASGADEDINYLLGDLQIDDLPEAPKPTIDGTPVEDIEEESDEAIKKKVDDFFADVDADVKAEKSK